MDEIKVSPIQERINLLGHKAMALIDAEYKYNHPMPQVKNAATNPNPG